MKRILSFLLALTFCLAMFAGCSFLPEEIKFCDVNFYVDGEVYDTKTVLIGQPVGMPKNPEKENFIFTGWCTDGLISYMYDFSAKVIGETNLHACFALDAIAVANMISTQTIKSTVEVISKSYNVASGTLVETEVQISQGSGVIVDISDGYCYVLTNAHVVDAVDGYAKQKIAVEDAYGNSYEAIIYKNSNKASSAISVDYDLALIYFKLSNTHSLVEIEMGEDPKIEDYVIAIGNPQGLQNAITYGYALGYQQVSGDEGSAAVNVEFDVLIHDAPIYHGSSGGALIDARGRLVGVNFAGSEKGSYGCAIPISKVIEFMNLYVY